MMGAEVMGAVLMKVLDSAVRGVGGILLWLSVSAYSDVNGAAPYMGLTYSGARTRPGVAACGPSLYLRTLYIYRGPERFVTCLDRGPAVTNEHVDVWLPTEAEALAWGRRSTWVIILPVPAPQVMPVWR